MTTKNTRLDGQNVRETVRSGYAAIATRETASCCSASRCGQSDPAALAQAVGYDAESLKNLPEGANMGLSCGNPVAIAALQPGQILPVAVARSIPLKGGGKTIAHGTIGAMDDRVAVQITQAF